MGIDEGWYASSDTTVESKLGIVDFGVLDDDVNHGVVDISVGNRGVSVAVALLSGDGVAELP